MNLYRMRLGVFVLISALFVSRLAQAEVSIVATTADIAAIARQVGGNTVSVSTLALPTQDPHFVDAKPSLALAMNRADLLIVQGLDLEIGWLSTLQLGARNPKIMTGAAGFLDVSTVVDVLEQPAGPISRAQGDIHRAGNPHYLYDPRNGAKVARAIAARLTAIDGAGGPQYEKNASAFERAALDLAQEFAGKFEKLAAERRKIVTYHRSWVYLENWLGLSEVGTIEPKPGIPPDPGHVAELLLKMKAQRVRAILSEEYYPEATAKLLAEKTGATLLRLPGGTGAAQSYLDHIKDLADRALGALSR